MWFWSVLFKEASFPHLNIYIDRLIPSTDA